MVFDSNQGISLNVDAELQILQARLNLWDPFLLKEEDPLVWSGDLVLKFDYIQSQIRYCRFYLQLELDFVLEYPLCGLMSLLLLCFHLDQPLLKFLHQLIAALFLNPQRLKLRCVNLGLTF